MTGEVTGEGGSHLEFRVSDEDGLLAVLLDQLRHELRRIGVELGNRLARRRVAVVFATQRALDLQGHATMSE